MRKRRQKTLGRKRRLNTLEGRVDKIHWEEEKTLGQREDRRHWS